MPYEVCFMEIIFAFQVRRVSTHILVLLVKGSILYTFVTWILDTTFQVDAKSRSVDNIFLTGHNGLGGAVACGFKATAALEVLDSIPGSVQTWMPKRFSVKKFLLSVQSLEVVGGLILLCLRKHFMTLFLVVSLWCPSKYEGKVRECTYVCVHTCTL